MYIDIMDGETVVRTIVADPAFAEAHYPGAWRVSEAMDAPTSAVVPSECTPAQGLVALYAINGITEQDVHAAIGGIADPVARYTVQVAFARASTWRRDSGSMQQLAALLGLANADLDTLFVFAAGVEV